MTKKANTPKQKQPPMLPKGASPAVIKAWLAACRLQMTPDEIAEYEEAGAAIKTILKRIGFDPKADDHAAADREGVVVQVDLS